MYVSFFIIDLKQRLLLKNNLKKLFLNWPLLLNNLGNGRRRFASPMFKRKLCYQNSWREVNKSQTCGIDPTDGLLSVFVSVAHF